MLYKKFVVFYMGKYLHSNKCFWILFTYYVLWMFCLRGREIHSEWKRLALFKYLVTKLKLFFWDKIFIFWIFLLKVHKRVKYLRHLIISLAQARDISKTLLVFSHDFYDEEINDLVQTIDFCKVIQVSVGYFQKWNDTQKF